MLFSSIPFLYYFLPCVLLLYFLTPARGRNAVLLVSSLIFYAWGEVRLVTLMLFVIFTGYICGLLLQICQKAWSKRLVLTGSVVMFTGILGYYKYADFFISNFNAVTGLGVPLLKVALPIGISFYTFQVMSYVVDVYRGNVPVQFNPFTLATYVAMFPQLIAGPIVRYADVAQQLAQREHSLEKAAYGIRRFVFGLSKKILLANALGELCELFRSSSDKSAAFYWLYAIAFTLHIYYDFSGYSDMAIGLGKLFGFDFMENFNYPYIAESITDFWRRWHMSLGTWFRDYVYIPLGGNRVSKPRWFFNILTVWLLTGFWHGASWNFIVWGLYFAVLLLFEKQVCPKLFANHEKARLFKHVYVMLAVVVSFVIFNAADMQEAFSDLGGMLGMHGVPLVSREAVYYFKSNLCVIIFAVLGATPLCKRAVLRVQESRVGAGLVAFLEPVILVILMLLNTAFLVDGSFNPFLYFRF